MVKYVMLHAIWEIDLKKKTTFAFLNARRTCKTRLGKFRSSSSVICVLYVGRSNTGGLSFTSFTWITTIVWFSFRLSDADRCNSYCAHGVIAGSQIFDHNIIIYYHKQLSIIIIFYWYFYSIIAIMLYCDRWWKTKENTTTTNDKRWRWRIIMKSKNLADQKKKKKKK